MQGKRWLNAFGSNAIVGGCLGMATGSGIASRYLDDGKVTICFAGDGAFNNGISHEAMNMACMAQFTNGLMGKKYGIPVIFAAVNNQYGMTGQQRGEVTGIDFLAERCPGYNKDAMHAEIVNGMDVLAVRDATKRAVDLARSGKGPIFLEFWCYRFTFPDLLIKEGIITVDELNRLKKEARERNEEMAKRAAEAKSPDPKDMYFGLFSSTTSDTVPEKFKNSPILYELPFLKRDPEKEITYREAVIEGLFQEMRRDRRVILWGEDIADYGGAFGATRGLLRVFGRERIFNTAISEAAIIGSGVGAALRGLRPVVEIMYIDFILQAMDQVGNQAAKWKYMSGGQATLPLTIRTTIGGGKGYAGQHSQSLEAILTHFPGLKVVAPSDAYDVKGMLASSIRDDNPVVFIEHQNLYADPLARSKVPKEEYLVPLGKAKIKREADTSKPSVTVIAWSSMVPVALKAAKQLEKDDIELEVVDIRSLYPLDMDTIVGSIERTNKVVIVHQAVQFMGFGADSSPVLEKAFLPNEKDIISVVEKILG